MSKPKKPKSKARRIIEWVLIGIFGTLFLIVGAGQIESMVHKDTYFGQPIRFGVGSFIVQTDSMEPEYKVDSAIITYRQDPETIYKNFTSGKTVDITFMDWYMSDTSFDQPTDKASYYNRTDPIRNKDGSLAAIAMTHRLREIHVDASKEVGKGRYHFIVSGINPEGNRSHPGQYQVFTEQYILGVVVLNSNFLGGVFSFVASPWGLFVLLLVPAFYLVIVSTLDIFKAMKEPKEVAAGADKPSSGVADLSQLSEKDKQRLKQEMLNQLLAKKAAEKKAAEEAAKKQEGQEEGKEEDSHE